MLGHVFEPFYSTKPKGAGTGLGLATVYGIVVQAQGDVHIYSTPDIGTTVSVLLPVTEADHVPHPQPAPVTWTSGGETVLVVDDEPALREVTCRILSRNGYQVLSAGSGAEALALVREYDGDIDLLVTDVIMPQMFGKEVAEAVVTLRPATRVLYMSGYAQPVLSSQGTLDAGVVLVEKAVLGVGAPAKGARGARPAGMRKRLPPLRIGPGGRDVPDLELQDTIADAVMPKPFTGADLAEMLRRFAPDRQADPTPTATQETVVEEGHEGA